MTTGTVFLEPFGGLGNRMRAIISAVKLANELGKRLEVIWDIGSDFNSPYEALFKSNPAFKVSLKRNNVLSSYNPSTLKRRVINTWNSLYGYDNVIWEQDHQRTFFSPGFKVSELAKHRNIYIRSCERFFGGDAWHIFEPVPEIQASIDDAISRFSSNTLGIHIRRSDNLNSIKFSPLEAFTTLIETELKNDPSTRLFLATDDQPSRDYILQKFATNTIHLTKEFSRGKEQGIREAVIDLFVLSNCTKIIGSYWSSFTDVAGMLRNRPVVIAATGDLP